MFKKRNIDKKVDINKDIESIEVNSLRNSGRKGLQNSEKARLLTEGDKDHDNSEQIERVKMNRYGLIEKQFEEEKPLREENLLLDLYVQMRMEEIHAQKERQAVDNTTNQILQMQKQYLSAAESKITEYDMKEVQKKLQKTATETIKNQIDNRSKYLVELLQNQFERMEYASKKQLKVIKQDRQRLERELSSKYAPEGRRHYIEYVRQQNLKGLK